MKPCLNTTAALALAALAGAPVAARELLLTTNNAQQQIEVEVGPLAGEVRVFGISTIPSGQLYTGVTSIRLRTGTAQDFVEFRVFADQVPPITVNTGLGNSDVKFIYAPAALGAVTSTVTVTGGTGNDKVAFEVISEAPSFDAFWTVNHSSGDNEVAANVLVANPSDLLAIDLYSTSGAGQDKIETQIVSAAARLELGFGGVMGAGNDAAFLTIDEIAAGNASVLYSLNLGEGFDSAGSSIVMRGGAADLTGTINGAGGDDTITTVLEGFGSTMLSLVGGAGNDVLESEYKGAVTGAPLLSGGTGNDLLKMIVSEPALISPTLNGGAGFDEGVGFGRFIGIEKRS